MANLKAIKRKIASVKNTRQITKAMKMVAGAKLKKAQLAMNEFKPYATAYEQVIVNMTNNILLRNSSFFQIREKISNVGFIVITSDRGLCGAFNVNIFKEVLDSIKKRNLGNNDINLYIAGKKGADFFKRHGYQINFKSGTSVKKEESSIAEELSKVVTDDFINGKIDELYIISSRYFSPINQKPDCKKIFPFEKTRENVNAEDYVIEPDSNDEEVLSKIFNDYVKVEIDIRLFESNAGEQASRMNAMDNATRNAGKLINKLTLSYNKARQTAVTLEILDLVNGANALK
ncbi:MAG: ATP synthase F1 subunit gamma [Candidatus Acididesulfobacter guangdongensis]|uniref:ATP synthase gamma chain n=1 Tax=Acididesulfobacter guangdongensis TaxID=2597225 RepID=A0A519BIR6_ACIG2|nr:MAG: ATP synthase F1 subunit gamma [Candidatus Acididesulfobacter guangdongensis]